VWGAVLDRIADGKLIESRIITDNIGMVRVAEFSR
jgi:hypothetical protein